MKKKFSLFIFIFLSIFIFNLSDVNALQQLSCTSSETVGTDAYNKQCSNVLLSKAEFASCGGYTCNAWHNTNKKLEYPLGQYFTINAPYLYNDAYYPSIIYRIGSSDYLHYDFDKDSYYSIVYTFKFDHDVNINEDIDLTNNFNVQSYKGLLYSSSTDVFSDYHINLEKFQSSESEYYVYLYFDFTPKDTINKLKFYVGNENFDESEDFILTTDIPNSQVTRSYYYDFAVYDEYQYADIPTHGGGGINWDDPSSEDEAIFANLQQCEPLDVGCHVSNILEVVKTIFIRIGNGIKNIFDAIKSIPDFIKSIPDLISDLFDKASDFFKYIFIPEDDYFKNKFDELYSNITDILGFLAYPFTLVLNTFEFFLTIEDTGSYVFTWDNITVPNFESHVIIPAGSFDFGTLLQDSRISLLRNIAFVFMNTLLLLAFLQLCKNKYNQVFGGEVSEIEFITVAEEYDVDYKTGEVSNIKHIEKKTTRRDFS